MSNGDSQKVEKGILGQIETVVHLMFENRSLDNVLGWLYDGESPRNMVPAILSGPQYDGLQTGKYKLPLRPHWWSKTEYYPIEKGVKNGGFYAPTWDPYEEYPNVINQLFGDAENTVYQPPGNEIPAPMQGFLQDFSATYESWDAALQITETYTPDDLPILNGLAKQYAISDRWYCSMPTQTNPNRAFSLCGTSLGRLVNQKKTAVETFETKTIWNALAEKDVSMGIYYHELWKSGKCFTQYTFPHMNSVDSSLLSIEKINDPNSGFYALARAGKLPNFTYIEPKWGYGISSSTSYQGNDYHPPTDVRFAEKLLYDVYQSLKANDKAWKKTLLIVTFDEHGGTYDHHAPPWGAVNPGDPKSLEACFKFNLYGVRVPTLLISPYIQPGTVFRAPTESKYPFDHTSVLASLLKWKGIDPAKSGLWDRVAVAPSIENTFSDSVVNPGADLVDPGDQFRVDAEPLVDLKGVPEDVIRYIYSIAKSEQEVFNLVADYERCQEK